MPSPQFVQPTQCVLYLAHQIQRAVEQDLPVASHVGGLHPPHQLGDVVRITLDGPFQNLLCYRVIRGQEAVAHDRRRAT